MVTPLVGLLLVTFRIGTLPALTLTMALLPETVATFAVAPARLVVPPKPR